MPTVQFWYEFASSYDYHGAIGFEAQARLPDLAIAWRPLLLSATLGQGVSNSPFNIYPDPAKARYRWRDAAPNYEATEAGLGFFGGPILIAADREMVRGDDSLEQALDWAASHASRPHRLIVLDRRP